MTYSVKIRKNKRYLKELVHKIRLYFAKILFERQVKTKILVILEWTINIVVTGFFINYVLNNKNIISYGMIVFLIQFYIKWFIQTIKDHVGPKKPVEVVIVNELETKIKNPVEIKR